MGFSRQDYWSGLPFTSPGNLPDPGTEPTSLCLLHCRIILYHCATGEAYLLYFLQTLIFNGPAMICNQCLWIARLIFLNRYNKHHQDEHSHLCPLVYLWLPCSAGACHPLLPSVGNNVVSPLGQLDQQPQPTCRQGCSPSSCFQSPMTLWVPPHPIPPSEFGSVSH